MTRRKVLVCFGTGIATSVQVSHKLKALLKDRGIDAMLAECKAIELASKAQSMRPHAIVSTTMVTLPPGGPRIFQGVPFLTGMGAAALADEIAAHLKSLKA